MPIWNPWHGCRRISPGCAHCYVYRRDASVGKDASQIVKTGDFDLPLRRNREKQYVLQPEDGAVYTCMTSDFFLEEADGWREDCWRIMKKRSDLSFVIITKRIHRFLACVPADWGAGYPNVTICCTCEDQARANFRLPIFLNAPICHRHIIHEPMLEAIRIAPYLESGEIDLVICGGESGPGARVCDYSWILATREQCVRYGVPFSFKQTGAVFRKDGKTYQIERRLQHIQAKKADIDFLRPSREPAEAEEQITFL